MELKVKSQPSSAMWHGTHGPVRQHYRASCAQCFLAAKACHAQDPSGHYQVHLLDSKVHFLGGAASPRKHADYGRTLS